MQELIDAKKLKDDLRGLFLKAIISETNMVHVHDVLDIINRQPVFNKEKEEESRDGKGRWFSVKEKPPKIDCPIIDTMHNLPYIPRCGFVTVETENGNRYFVIDSDFDFDMRKFFQGKEVMLDGEPARILPSEIEYWCELPDLPVHKGW